MLLGNFKRKAYERYIRQQAVKGDNYAQAELNVKKAYTQGRGRVPISLREVYAEEMGLLDKSLGSKNWLLRGGRYKNNGFVANSLNEDPLSIKHRIRKANGVLPINKPPQSNVVEHVIQVDKNSARKVNKTLLGVGLAATAIGGLIAVKATQRKTKKGKLITVKGYSRKRKR